MCNSYTTVVYFLFCLIILPVIHSEVVAAGQDECLESRCSEKGPTIRFPFRIKDKQPTHCGYPGFDLSCTEKKQTLLELPTSVKLHVKKIDYISHSLHLYDPESCLPKSLTNLSLSINSPFMFPDFPFNFTLFNCLSFYSTIGTNFEVPCLSRPRGYKVYAIDSTSSLSYATFSSCTKMYDLTSVPVSSVEYNNGLVLTWVAPYCTDCEEARMKCRWTSNNGTECYGKLQPRKGDKSKVWIAISVLGFVVLVLVMIVVYFKYKADKADEAHQLKIEKFLEDYRAMKPARYSYADIKRLTGNFKDKLGQGSYGTVFKGKLSSKVLVAVKILNSSTGDGEEFINEVGTMGQIHHVNVVRLVGYCADGFRRALVYEFLSNESLDKFIFPSNATTNSSLGWEKLQEIGLGVAKGIDYLHQGCEKRILHFDIKPQNVLLDENFNPKISDFGLAKLCSKDESAVSMTAARGTVGYIAPEVLSRNFGKVSYKSDVYSFGMLLLEMVGGRKNIDVTKGNTSQIYFPEWAYNRLEQGEEIRIEIEEKGDAEIARKLAIVGLWCIQWNPIGRPSMKSVVQMLEGGGDDLPVPPNPFASTSNKRSGISSAARHLHLDLGVISETE